MAITRAQQARQMLKNAGAVEQDGVMNYIKNSESVTVPKEFKARSNAPATKLAYITADEAKMLKKEKPGTPHKGPKGIPSYDSFDAQGNYTSGEAMSAAERGDIAGAQREGMDRDDARDIRAGAVAAGAGPRDSDDKDIQKRAREIKKESAKRKRDARRAITKEEKKEARLNQKRIKLRLEKDRIRRQERLKGIFSGAEQFTYIDPITGEPVTEDLNPGGLTTTELNELTASGLTDIGPKTELQQDLIDQFLEKSDKFSGAEMEAFKEKFNMPDLPGVLGLGLNIASPFLKKGSRKTKDFFTDDVLDAGRFTYKGQVVTPEMFQFLSPTEMQEVYGDYMNRRQAGDIDAYGNPIFQRDDDRGSGLPILPQQPQPQDPTNMLPQISPLFYRFMADGGMTNDAPMMQGGITDLALRDEFFLGGVVKGIKKGLKGVTRAVKKIAKSPIGKAALLAAGGSYALGLGPFASGSTMFGGKLAGLKGSGFLKSQGLKEFFFKDGVPGLKNLSDKGIIAALTATPFIGELLGLNEQKEEPIFAGPGVDFNAQPFYRLAADGGLMRQQYQEGSKEPVAKKTMPLIDMGGKEKDYRETGGFVDMGRMEKADDVPARLSKNEFVFTAEAVRNAGDGDVDKGSEVMYNMMKNLESGGDVSEESQGLEGAREMFQTSKRLEEVI